MRKAAAVVVLLFGFAVGDAVFGQAKTQAVTTQKPPQASNVAELRARADRGEADAQYELGINYTVDRDFTQAVVWYQKAAQQGHAKAQNSLGLLYNSGQGVVQDYAEAVAWWRKAAEQGLAKAQWNLGIALAHGEGVPLDLVEAHKWLNLAASRATRGEAPGFAEIRNLTEKRMTPAQVAEAQKRARDWAEAFERRQKK